MDSLDGESDPQADRSLPGWTYGDRDFFEAEIARIFRPSWQIVAHDSDIPSPGDYRRLDYAGESVILIRGEDGHVRAFANSCRHRGARLLDAEAGCARRLTCPYHGWTYDSAGRLAGVPGHAGYAGLDMARHGLTPVEVEDFHGFLFVRLKDDGGPSVAQMMAPHAGELALYRPRELRALERVTLRPRAVNWKIIGENYVDALHVPVAHPGLRRLMGESYGVRAGAHADRAQGVIGERPSPALTERAYQQWLPRVPHLAPDRQRLWVYIKLWPNIGFDIYPDQIDFMQWIPLSPTRTLIREVPYALPDARREMRAARYCNWRINRQVNAEDTALIDRVQAGMASESFTSGPLSDEEPALRHFCARMRRVIPEARLPQAPPAGWHRLAGERWAHSRTDGPTARMAEPIA